MVYNWLFSPLNNTYINISNNILVYIIEFLIPRLIDIINTPILHPEILWIVLPLIIATILMMLYFGRYRTEQLGWNTAFSNNIVLIFVSINLIQHLSGNNLLFSDKAMFVYFILAYNIIQLFINYFHLIPKWVAFIINSTIPINVMHYLAIIITYSNIPFDTTTMLTSFILILFMYALMKILWRVVPMSRGSKIVTTMKEKKEVESKKILYIILFILNRFFINLEDYYLIILSTYFIISSLIYMRVKKLKWGNLFIESSPVRRNMSILIGLLIFTYYTITSNFFTEIFSIGGYEIHPLLFVFNIIIVTITSEVFFRGLIQRGLKEQYNVNISVVIQAVLWILLKKDLFIISLTTLIPGLLSLVLLYPIGLLLGYLKETWRFDSVITAASINALLAIIFVIL